MSSSNKYKDLATKVLSGIGGESNVKSVMHCATRLRFNLKDDTKANTSKIENIPGVISVVNKGGQYQVVIGNTVTDVYNELLKLGSFNAASSDENAEEEKHGINKIIDIITGIFIPIVPALAGAGMVQAISSLLLALHWISMKSSTYQIFYAMGNAMFYFLPIILAGSAAKKFKVNRYVAMAIGAILVYPNFITLVAHATKLHQSISFLGIPVTPVNYGSSVIPILLAVWSMSYIEPFIHKHMIKAIDIFATPMITLLVVGTLTLTALGPLGFLAGKLLGDGIAYLNVHISWLVPTVIGALTPLLVMTGMHYGLIPIGIKMLASDGYDSVAGPGMMVSNLAQSGAAMAVAIRSRKEDTKSLAVSTGISAACGITEPVLYGINLKYKRPLIAAMIGGGLGGLFLGLMHVVRYAQAAPGLLTLPTYISPHGFSNLIYAVIGCGISFLASFVIEMFLGIREEVEPDELQNTKTVDLVDEEISSPLCGQVMNISEIKDPVFASGALGQGVAIQPTKGEVYAPVSGEITMLAPTSHAIGITSNNGAEILIHLGMDTVELKGKYFDPQIKQGQHVNKGDLLMKFNMKKIKDVGYEMTTPVVVTNTAQYHEVKTLNEKTDVQVGEDIIVLTV